MSHIDAKRFSKIMRDLERVPSQAATKIAEDISDEIQSNFDRGVDPYGRHWRELADSTLERGRHEPALTDTRHGRESITVRALAGAGVRIVVGALYMIYHQFGGASHLRGPGGSYRLRHRNKHFGRDRDRSRGRERPPKRSFLPFDRIPARWREIVQHRMSEILKRRVTRG
jgi:phage gpG-like protein